MNMVKLWLAVQQGKKIFINGKYINLVIVHYKLYLCMTHKYALYEFICLCYIYNLDLNILIAVSFALRLK